MKKIITILMIVIGFSLVALTNVNAEDLREGPYISGPSDVEVGKTANFQAKMINGTNCTDSLDDCESVVDQDVTADATWTSSDETVATVNGGVVTGVKAGTVTVTACYTNSSSEPNSSGPMLLSPTPGCDSMDITVSTSEEPDDPHLDNLFIVLIFKSSQSYLTVDLTTYAVMGSEEPVEIGQTIQYEAKVCNLADATTTDNYMTIDKSKCTDATNPVWGSSNHDVLTITDSGLATIRGFGRTNITADVEGYEPSNLTYTVSDDTNVDTYNWLRLFIVDSSTTEVTYDGTSRPMIDKMLKIGSTLQLKAIVCKDSDATVSGNTKTWAVTSCREVPASWSTNNQSSITVNATGLVTAKKGGYNWDNIFATVDQSILGLAANERLDTRHNEVVIYLEGVEYSKNGINSRTEFVDDVITSSNPATSGVKYVLYATPLGLISGSLIFVKRFRKEPDTLLY